MMALILVANVVFWIAFPFVVKRFMVDAESANIPLLARAHEPAVGMPAIIKRIGKFGWGMVVVLAGAIVNFVNVMVNNFPDVYDEMLEERILFGWWGGDEY